MRDIEEYQPRDPQEIADCEAEATAETLLRRSVDYKESVIGGVVWGTLFLILFVTHFPMFLRQVRRD